MRAVKSPWRFLPPLLLLVLVGLGFWKHTAVEDWAKLHSYTPPAAIIKLADEDTMTPTARHIYYVNHPKSVSSSQEFSHDCPVIEQTIVLGCYQSGESGIFLRDVSDSRLSGVEEVTAAHEMLHGAYERLSVFGKRNVDAMLMDFYNKDVHDQRIIDTINAYKKSEPNDVINEMHSVLGTEVYPLSSELEDYYTRYFTNRSAITGFTSAYEAEFTSRLDKIKLYETQLNNLKLQINSEESSLSAQAAQLQADRQSLDGLRASGQLEQYNSRVASFNQEVVSYNAGVGQLKSDIDAYNSVVEAHNQLADELRGLYTSLGTSLNTQSSQ